MRPIGRWLVPLVAAACVTEAEGPPDCAVAMDDSPRTHQVSFPDCIQHIAWGPLCYTPAAASLDREGLLWAGGGGMEGLTGVTDATFQDEASWEAFQEGWWWPPPEDRPAMPEVDFSTHVVVLVHDEIWSTCGAGIADHGVIYYPESYGPMVYLRVEDQTGACLEQCDMEIDQMVIYAVRRESNLPVVCTERLNLCDYD